MEPLPLEPPLRGADVCVVLALTVKGRGRKVRKRHVPVSTPVAALLFEYLMAREIPNPQDAKRRDEPLLLNSQDRRWTRTGLSGLMARIGLEAGIGRFRVSAHKLRHTANVVSRFARYKDDTPLDRWTRSQLLTHESARAIDRYEHLLSDDLFRARASSSRSFTLSQDRRVPTVHSDVLPFDPTEIAQSLQESL